MACAVSSGETRLPYRFVSQVMSPYLKGRSIGVNLTPDKRCNYRCVYCDVDRSTPSPVDEFNAGLCREELTDLLDRLQWESSLGEVRYIALAGEGEPTSCVLLPKVVEAGLEALNHYRMSTARMVLMTNGTCLHTPWTREAMALLREAGGEVRIKLDAGTQNHMNAVNGTFYPIETLTDKIVSAGLEGEIVIQSCFLSRQGRPPSADEVSAYVDRVKSIRMRGGQIKKVLLCTLPQPRPVECLTPVHADTLAGIARRLEGDAGVRAGLL